MTPAPAAPARGPYVSEGTSRCPRKTVLGHAGSGVYADSATPARHAVGRASPLVRGLLSPV